MAWVSIGGALASTAGFAASAAPVVGIGSSIANMFGGDSTGSKTTEYGPPVQLPGYAESDAARGNWWDKLQEWGQQPGYGAISPDFKAIWENVSQKVQQYYHGGPMGGGAIAGLESNAAKRNMSDQPAMNREIGKYGAQEGQQLQDIAIQQAIQEATMAESGRKDWLTSLQNLSGLKPSYQGQTGSTTTTYGPPGSGIDAGVNDLLKYGAVGSNPSSGNMYPETMQSGLTDKLGAADNLDLGKLEELFKKWGVN